MPCSACFVPRSDQEAEWAALEEIEAADIEQQRHQAAEQERRELAMLQALLPPAAVHAAPRELTPEWAYPREQMQEWLAAQQAAVTASTEQLQHQGEGHEDGQEQQLQHAALMVQLPGEEQAGALAVGALAAQPFQQLPPLPSPITTATVNLDATLARLLVSAGNTPSGPLAKAAGRWEAADGDAAEQGGTEMDAEAEAVFLLEPVLPAPLGEGVRCVALALLGGCAQEGLVCRTAVRLGGLAVKPLALALPSLEKHAHRGFNLPPPLMSSLPGRRSAWRRASLRRLCAPASSA